MWTSRFHVVWVAVLLTVAWASELANTPYSVVATETVIPLPPPEARNVVVAQIAAMPHAAEPVSFDTCFEHDAEPRAVADQYALDSDFAIGLESIPSMAALYVQRSAAIWDYAERCNTAEYYKQAKPVKKLRTASLVSDDSHDDWPFGRKPGHSSGSMQAKGDANPFTFAQGGGSFGGGSGGGGFGGGSGGGGDPGGKNSGGGGPGLIGDTGPGDHPGDDKGSPGDPGDPRPGDGDGHPNPDPGTGNPGGNPGTGDGDPTVLPEPGTLALFLGMAVGLGVMRRRRVSSL